MMLGNFNSFLLSEDFLVNYFGRFQAEFSRLLFLPWIYSYSWVVNPFVFRRIKRELLPFLVTRTIFSGSGKITLPPGDRMPPRKTHPLFSLSGRAAAIKSICRIYFDDVRRPVIDLRDFFIEPLSALSHRKRLHIMLSDSNMSTIGVYLKFGITGLILDMIEHGHSFKNAHLINPLAALKTVSGDTRLREKLPIKGKKNLTALEIQKYYCAEARAYYARQESPQKEVQDILEKWEFMLQSLEITPHLLYRKVDWVTKKNLMEEVLRDRSSLDEIEEISGWLACIQNKCGAVAPPDEERAEVFFRSHLGREAAESLKVFLSSKRIPLRCFLRRWQLFNEILKVDFKFHQVDGEGYYYKLLESRLVDDLFTGEEIERAKENPPLRTRAYIRGHLVKKFGYKSERGEDGTFPESPVFARTRIGWSTFYLKWPWKKITFKNPFDCEYASIEKTLDP